MTYSPYIPQPPQIPANMFQDILSNFEIANSAFNSDHVPYAGVISNITQANPASVTSIEHTLSTGNMVTFQGLNDNPLAGSVTGMGALNGVTATITVVDQNTFTLNGIDSTAYVPYIQGSSSSYTSTSLLNGYHKHVTFPNNASDPNLGGTYTSVYPKWSEPTPLIKIAQLYFQNGNASSFVSQLTNLGPYKQIGNTRGIKTPWGLIINFGQISLPITSTYVLNVTFPMPYTSLGSVDTIICTPFISAPASSSSFVSAIATSASQFTVTGASTSLPAQLPVFYIAVGT